MISKTPTTIGKRPLSWVILGVLFALLHGCAVEELVALQPYENIDDFLQEAQPKVDILWVVDNSPSTVDEQTKIAREAPTLLRKIIEAKLEYRMGVITTDIDERGILRSYNGNLPGCRNCNTVTKSIPCTDLNSIDGSTDAATIREKCPALEVFQSLIQVGSAGGALENGFEQVIKALGIRVDRETGLPQTDIYDNLDLSPVNPGFLRDDASLMIIFVSDEDESLELDGTPVRFYARLLSKLKKRSSAGISVNSIVGWHIFNGDFPPPVDTLCSFLDPVFDNNPGTGRSETIAWEEAVSDTSLGCINQNDNSFATSGYRYIELACRLGGTVGNICSSSFENVLDNLASQTIDLSKELILSQFDQLDRGSDCLIGTADDGQVDCNGSPATICVEIESPSGTKTFLTPSAANGWALDETRGSISYDPTVAPQTGSTIRLRYRVNPGLRCASN